METARGVPQFVWCDLEMTGLDPESCSIIEIGLIVTDAELRPLAEFQRAIWQPESVLGNMVPFVKDMHTKNGLLERVRKSDVALRDAEKDAMSFVLSHCHVGEGILAGNSIHTDRAFIHRHMPGLDRSLHYRMIDVSSLKILIRAWYPRAQQRAKAEADHTVLSDIRASISELQFYREHFFKVGTT